MTAKGDGKIFPVMAFSMYFDALSESLMRSALLYEPVGVEVTVLVLPFLIANPALDTEVEALDIIDSLKHLVPFGSRKPCDGRGDS